MSVIRPLTSGDRLSLSAFQWPKVSIENSVDVTPASFSIWNLSYLLLLLLTHTSLKREMHKLLFIKASVLETSALCRVFMPSQMCLSRGGGEGKNKNGA